MEREETKQILGIIYSTYQPSLLPPMTKELLAIWHELLQDVPYKLASAAVAAWLQTEKYPPTIAAIREKVFDRTESGQTPERAWTAVQLAVSRYGHTEPDLAKQVLGDLWQLVGNDWPYYCTLPIEQIPNEKARFIRMYATQQHRSRTQAQIAEPIRAALASGKLQIGDGT